MPFKMIKMKHFAKSEPKLLKTQTFGSLMQQLEKDTNPKKA